MIDEDKYDAEVERLKKLIESGVINRTQNRLLLKKYRPEECQSRFELLHEKIFGTNERVFAGWVNCSIEIFYGDVIDMGMYGLNKFYSKTRTFLIVDGIIVDSVEKTNTFNGNPNYCDI